MGHANDNNSWEDNFGVDDYLDCSTIGSDQLRRRHSVPLSTRSSVSTECSIRTGSAQLDMHDLSSFSSDRDSWSNTNTLTSDNASLSRNTQEITQTWLEQMPRHYRDLSQPPLPPRPRETIPPEVPSRTKPVLKGLPDFVYIPSSSESNNTKQSLHSSIFKHCRTRPEGKTDKPPLSSFHQASSLPDPHSPNLTPPKPPLPPKPVQFYLEPNSPTETPNHPLPKFTHEYLQPKVPPKPDEDYLQPLLPPKPQQNNLPLPLPPKPSLQNVPPKIPPKLPQQDQLPFESQVPLLPISLSIPSRAPSCSDDLTPPTPQPPSIPQWIPPRTPSGSDDNTTPPTPQQPALNRELHHYEYEPRRYRRAHFLLNRGCLITAGLVSFLLSLASVALLILVMINPFTYHWQDRTFKEKAYTACLKCLHLMRGMEDPVALNYMKKLYNEAHDGEMYCCAKTSDQFSVLLKLILRQQEPGPNYTAPAKEQVMTSPSAHLMLTLNSWNSTSKLVPEGHLIMKFNPSDTKGYNQSITVRENWLEVQVTGWYYVYTNIFYKASCDNKDRVKFKTLEHHIRRRCNEEPNNGGILVKTAHTCGEGTAQEDRKSVFAGGIFQLLRGDEIFFSLSSSTQNIDNARMPYLGLVMIGQ